MPELLRLTLTLTLFIATIALVMIRPRHWNEAWWTGGAALIAIGLRLVSVRQVIATVTSTSDVLLFLIALLLMSALLEASGFFDWAAVKAAQLAKGDPWKLFRNIFLLGSAITATMSLDTTAVILTPVVVSAVQRLKLPMRPYVLLCAFIANFASLLLPVSNLTNLLYASAFGLSFGAYTARMVLPQAAALVATYATLRWLHGRQLPAGFDVELLPAPETEIRNVPYFRGCRIILGVVLAGYFIAPVLRVQPYVVGFCGCAALAIAGIRHRALPAGLIRHVSWAVVPFVAGLFVVVQAVENCGAVDIAMRRLTAVMPTSPAPAALCACLGSAVLSNLVNNLPAGLISIGLLRHASPSFAVIGGSLVGTNIGPGITIFGSLATILVVDAARKRGENIRAADLMRDGILVTPLAATAAVAALVCEALIGR